MITASIVKELRDKTSAPMMDCKKVLTETNGDLEASIKLLRERGIMKSAKMSDRAANEGVITARINAEANSGILIEVNCETDFVSKNESFQAFVGTLADTLAASSAGGTRPTISSGFRWVPDSIHWMRSSVGVTIGKPSDHSLAKKNSNSSSFWLKAGVLIESQVSDQTGIDRCSGFNQSRDIACRDFSANAGAPNSIKCGLLSSPGAWRRSLYFWLGRA